MELVAVRVKVDVVCIELLIDTTELELLIVDVNVVKSVVVVVVQFVILQALTDVQLEIKSVGVKQVPIDCALHILAAVCLLQRTA